MPPSSKAKIAKAAQLYEQFTGHDAEWYQKVDVEWPEVALQVGQCDGILYTTVRDQKTEHYIHKFKKTARPTLVASHDGRTISLIGGNYTFTDRGIVDN